MEKFSDLKISSSKKPPNLCDLPMEIVEMIVEKLDFTRRLIVRKTCKTLRKVIDGLKPCCCNEIKMTVGLEECELKIEGHSIKYKPSDEGTDSEVMLEMLTKMIDDLSFLSDPQFQLDTLIFRHNNASLMYQTDFSQVVNKRLPQSVSVRSLVLEEFEYNHHSIWYLAFWKSKMKLNDFHVTQLENLTKLEDDIMRVKIHKTKYIDSRIIRPWSSCIKYYREGQRDILVDEPGLLLPKNTVPVPKSSEKSTEPGNPQCRTPLVIRIKFG
uniref:F-box domain-containing protein n=1 Tax=Caenorhabditis tropicalis TaxID=1561998 RepID=A0A1I7UEU7_9PELO